MENPDTWGEAEKIVSRVLDDYRANQLKPPGERIIGLSLERQITDALRKAGKLDHDSPYESCPWCHPGTVE